MKKVKLKDILEIKNGKDYKHLNPGSIPVYGSGGFMLCVNESIHEGDSILLPRKGTLNNIQYVKGKFWTVDTIYYTKVSNEVNAYFLYNYLKLLNLSGLDSGSALPSMTQGAYYDLEVCLPSKDIQDSIAECIRTLDAKIELNNKINTELEAMAKTLYDYWFVQFDFPDENGNPYKSSGGKMVWSEELKREIPEGWEVKRVSELIAESKSGDWGKDVSIGNYTQEVLCIRGADINGLNGKEQCEPPRRFILENNDHKLLKPYDLIIEISGGSPTQSTGRIAHISPTTAKRFTNPLICSNFCKALSLKDYKLAYNFHFFWNRLYDNKIFFGYEGKTSGIKNFLFDSFVKTNFIIVPSDKVKNNFFDIMENIEEKRQKILEENQKLAELRDFILPMLMNGQTSVSS